MITGDTVSTPFIKRMFPKYTWIEWLLLAEMLAMLFITPIVWPAADFHMVRYAIFAEGIGFFVNAYFWQDQKFMDLGYNSWLWTCVGGAAVAIIGPYTHAAPMIIMTGIICVYAAPWSMLRLFLRKRFLSDRDSTSKP